jgi:aryl-alcohol dehydrogenase-like predicted oxidoreductase
MAGLWMILITSPQMTLRLVISGARVRQLNSRSHWPILTRDTLVPKFQGENFYKNKAIVDEIKKLAVRKGCSVAQIALAWVAAQGLITIPGTTKTCRLTENWASRDILLTQDELKQMREIVDAAKPVGERFAPIFESMVGH